MRARTWAVLLVAGFALMACDRVTTEPGPLGDTGPAMNVDGRVLYGQSPALGPMQVGEPCGLVGSDAAGNPIFGGTGTVTNIVENKNHVILMCHGSDIVNLSGRGQTFHGITCGIIVPSTGQFVITTDSRATVSASGQASLWCRYSF